MADLRNPPGGGDWNDRARSLKVCSGGCPPPQGVRFYADITYSGDSFPAGAGEIADLAATNWSQRISSIRIPPGKTVILYEDTNFGGPSLILTADISDLRSPPGGGDWNDRARSLRVCNGACAAEGVLLYADINYSGDFFPAGVGAIADLATTNWSQRISSLRIPQGRTVILYEGTDFTGAYITLTADAADLRSPPGGENWNDRARSLKICNGGCPAPEDIRFYADINYSGEMFSRSGGEITDLAATNWSQRISSLRIPQGRTVVLYEGTDFTGAYITLTADTAVLRSPPGGDDWNDRARSLKIQ